MAISPERFHQEFDYAIDLMGWQMKPKRKDIIYEEVMKYEPEDLGKALSDMKGKPGPFDYAFFIGRMNYHQGERIDNENTKRKEREEREADEWFRKHKGKKHECINDYVCGDCRRRFCPIVQKAGKEACIAILNHEKTVEEAEAELGAKFKGIGWPSPVEEPEPF